jgi:hypothetical protein
MTQTPFFKEKTSRTWFVLFCFNFALKPSLSKHPMWASGTDGNVVDVAVGAWMHTLKDRRVQLKNVPQTHPLLLYFFYHFCPTLKNKSHFQTQTRVLKIPLSEI